MRLRLARQVKQCCKPVLMCDGRQTNCSLFAVSHYPIEILDALNATPLCSSVCDAVKVDRVVIREYRQI